MQFVLHEEHCHAKRPAIDLVVVAVLLSDLGENNLGSDEMICSAQCLSECLDNFR